MMILLWLLHFILQHHRGASFETTLIRNDWSFRTRIQPQVAATKLQQPIRRDEANKELRLFSDSMNLQHAVSCASTPLSEFLLEREVRVRPPTCEDSGMLPLSMYRGTKPKHSKKQKTYSSVPSPLQLIEKGDTNNEVFTRWFQNVQEQLDADSPCPNSSTLSLSTSSAALLSQWDQLSIPEQHRLYQKIQAEQRASRPLNPDHAVHLLYYDGDFCVAYKPSGVLSVPGPRRNPSLVNLIHDLFYGSITNTVDGSRCATTNRRGSSSSLFQAELSYSSQQRSSNGQENLSNLSSSSSFLSVDQMVVHRLDMDTSGLIVFAFNRFALSMIFVSAMSRRPMRPCWWDMYPLPKWT